ncbi:hypothetical protein [Rivularia sp. UHCC 0363]|uniref:hypothetical protein n=1 Tax=Rivularia sp. UHCC 0363 TaxID=3110244 RepID=UPI002B1F77E4|nr:hypothetical protein [Rivularia sp. UHCC 0363]MEA5597560.1 hypothetical protein [Rivularia sp. UHCC 0363]
MKRNGCGSFLLGVVFTLVLISGAGIWFFLTNKQAQQLLSKQIDRTATELPGTVDDASVTKPPVTSKTSVTQSSQVSVLPTEKTLNVQTTHPNGTVGILTKISFTKDSTKVEMSVTNGSKNTIELNRNGKEMVLVDDLGKNYSLAAPATNPDVEILPGTTLKGEFIFMGKVSPETKSLNLITNNQSGGDETLSQIPKMKFFIPLS